MQVAVITGAASGIGAGLAQEAIARGLHVVLADRDADKLAATAHALGAQASAMPTDVTDAASVQRLADHVWDMHGRVDYLFNNAGVLSTGLSWELPLAQWQQALQVNIMGIVHGLHAFVPRMQASGQPGHIINTASMGGFVPSAMLPAYSATKAAAVAMTESLLGELAQAAPHIKVSLLAPGAVKTSLFDTATSTDNSAPMHHWMRTSTAQTGMDTLELARHTWDALARGDYWIFPHPQMLDMMVGMRHQMITARKPPLFQWSAQEIEKTNQKLAQSQAA